jgi:hypothetical protein
MCRIELLCSSPVYIGQKVKTVDNSGDCVVKRQKIWLIFVRTVFFVGISLLWCNFGFYQNFNLSYIFLHTGLGRIVV